MKRSRAQTNTNPLFTGEIGQWFGVRMVIMHPAHSKMWKLTKKWDQARHYKEMLEQVEAEMNLEMWPKAWDEGTGEWE